ncbi:unnamed protein product [Pseudo-nitzschia multistriata]|uniref:Uncharacterized protein n=1 Tax=Pseudo-nitzschia multistriata TaxID=183589 RepID=A0A448ZFF6_9STRA|nr:unnamed protein product [Pseudo-nitzschia multistriata]
MDSNSNSNSNSNNYHSDDRNHAMGQPRRESLSSCYSRRESLSSCYSRRDSLNSVGSNFHSLETATTATTASPTEDDEERQLMAEIHEVERQIRQKKLQQQQQQQHHRIGETRPRFFATDPEPSGARGSASHWCNGTSSIWEIDDSCRSGTGTANERVDLWAGNRRLEDSINRLKNELSATNLSRAGSSRSNNAGNNSADGNANNPNHGTTTNNANANANHESSNRSSPCSLLFSMVAPVTPEPSKQSMQMLPRIPTGAPGGFHRCGPKGFHRYGAHPHANANAHGEGDHGVARGSSVRPQQDEDADMGGLDPVPFDEVFCSGNVDAKRRELISNLAHLDLFRLG